MNRFFRMGAAFGRSLFPEGARVATPALVFFTTVLVVIAQLPENILLQTGYVSGSILLNEFLVVAGIPLILIWLQGFDRKKLLPLRPPSARLIALLLIFMTGAAIAIDYATAASERVLPLPAELQEIFDRLMAVSSRSEVFWKLIVLCAVPAVCEEIFFRGFCQASLEARWGAPRAVVTTAVIFAVLHGNPYYLHLYFLLGLIFGWVFLVTRTLWAPILCHVLNNAWTFLNHVRDFKLPIDGAPLEVNAAVGLAGVVLALATAVLVRAAAQEDLRRDAYVHRWPELE